MKSDILFGLFLGILPGIVIAILFLSSVGSEKSESKFQVVDTYKNCEVIRYTPEGRAKYTYLLNCRTP